MKTMVYFLLRCWRSLRPPYRHYWMYVEVGWMHERHRAEIAEDVKRQPVLCTPMQTRLLAKYEAQRDACWAKADELMRVPLKGEL